MGKIVIVTGASRGLGRSIALELAAAGGQIACLATRAANANGTVAEIEENGGETYTFRTGDSFVMKPGVVGIWRTIETVRKIYVTVSE